jgi:hypothetical protein
MMQLLMAWKVPKGGEYSEVTYNELSTQCLASYQVKLL